MRSSERKTAKKNKLSIELRFPLNFIVRSIRVKKKSHFKFNSIFGTAPFL